MRNPIDLPPASDGLAKNKWLMDQARKPRDVLRFIELNPSGDHYVRLAAHVLNVRISEIDEISTKRIVRLTWALVALTAALLVFTVYLYKDTHALIEREQTAQPHESKNP